MLRPKRVAFNGSPNEAEQARQAAAGAAAKPVATAQSTIDPGVTRIPPVSGRPPALTGIGGQNIYALRVRVREIRIAIGLWGSDLPLPAAALISCLPPLSALINVQDKAMSALDQQMSVQERMARDIAMSAARDQLQQQQPLAPISDKAVETQAQKLLDKSVLVIVDQLTADFSQPAAEAVNAALEAIEAARDSLIQATFDADFPSDVDEDFVRHASVLTQTILGKPLAQRMRFLVDLYDRALQLNDDAKALIIEYSGRPLATAVAEASAGVFAPGTHSRSALRTGDVTNEIAAATKFLNVSAARIKQRSQSSSLGQAREAMKQIEQVFVKTCGRDASDPASVESADFQRMLSSKSFQIGELVPDAAKDGTPRWLFRYARSQRPVRLLPWQDDERATEINVTARKAVSQ